MEEWRPVVGYEGIYEVSNLGNIKSLNYHRSGEEGTLSANPDKNGYMKITLCKNGKTKSHLLHRLVAEAFIPNPDNLPDVNHKDENPSNNHLDNLEWCTREYNINYGSRNKKLAKKISKKVKCITTGEIFNCIKEANEKYNIHCGNIGQCCKGKLKSAGKHPITGEKLVWEFL